MIGEAFVQRTPGRFDGFDLDGGQVGPALVLPLRATDTVAGVLVALRHAGPSRSPTSNSTSWLLSPTKRRWRGSWPAPSARCAS